MAAIQAGDTQALKQKELQDFIIQRGVITPFSSKDDVLGMKKGGAISQLLGESGGSSSKLAALQIAAIETSNKYLYQLVELTKILVKKPAGGGTTAPPSVAAATRGSGGRARRVAAAGPRPTSSAPR